MNGWRDKGMISGIHLQTWIISKRRFEKQVEKKMKKKSVTMSDNNDSYHYDGNNDKTEKWQTRSKTRRMNKK